MCTASSRTARRWRTATSAARGTARSTRIRRSGVVSEFPGTLVLDGDNGLGPVVGDYAMRQAIEKARENGVGTVTVRNSNHYASCCNYP